MQSKWYEELVLVLVVAVGLGAMVALGAVASSLVCLATSELWPLVLDRTGSFFLGIGAALGLFFLGRFFLSFYYRERGTPAYFWVGLWLAPLLLAWELHFCIPNWRQWTPLGVLTTVGGSLALWLSYLAVNFPAKWLGKLMGQWWTKRRS